MTDWQAARVEPYTLWLIFRPDGSPYFPSNWPNIEGELDRWEKAGYLVRRLRIIPSLGDVTIAGLIDDDRRVPGVTA